MDKKFGYYVFGGMLIGALLGLGWSSVANPLVAVGMGALVGTAIGWFIAAAIFGQKENK